MPSVPAGGTVEFVDFFRQQYTADVKAREEGGTPDILGSIRAALVFSLKQFVGADAINLLEDSYLSAAFKAWCAARRAWRLKRRAIAGRAESHPSCTGTPFPRCTFWATPARGA